MHALIYKVSVPLYMCLICLNASVAFGGLCLHSFVAFDSRMEFCSEDIKCLPLRWIDMLQWGFHSFCLIHTKSMEFVHIYACSKIYQIIICFDLSGSVRKSLNIGYKMSKLECILSIPEVSMHLCFHFDLRATSAFNSISCVYENNMSNI